ncbi:MAG: hypothetical protein ACTSUE_04955 [Promethearchaeota archaeon]
MMLIRAAGFPIIFMHSIIVTYIVTLTGILFVKLGFFMNRTSPFKYLIVLSTVFFVLGLYMAYLQENPLTYTVGRLWRTIFSNIQFMLVASWHARVSFHDYKRILKMELSRSVKKRYLIFGIASLLIASTSIIDIIGTFLSIYAGVDYLYVMLPLLVLIFIYCIMNFLIWIMPNWYKKFLERDSLKEVKPMKGIVSGAGSDGGGVKSPGKKIPGLKVMELIDYYGAWLAERISKEPSACKGLLLMAIETELGEDGIYALNLGNMLEVFKNALHKKLEALGITKHDKIIKDLLEELVEYQSLLSLVNA